MGPTQKGSKGENWENPGKVKTPLRPKKGAEKPEDGDTLEEPRV